MRQFVCDQTQPQRISIQCMCHKQLILHKAETFSVLHCHQRILIQCFDAVLSGGHIGGRKKETFPIACGSMAVFVGRARKASQDGREQWRFEEIGFAARSRALCALLRLLRSVVRSAKPPCYAGYLSHIMDQYRSWIKDSHGTESLVKSPRTK